MSKEIRYELDVVKWEGKIHCAYLNNFRIAGGKPWAGGQTVKKWSVTARDVIQSIPELQTLSKNFDAAQSELAALREELAEANRQIQLRDELGCMTCGGDGHVHRIDGEYLGPCTACFAYEFSCTKHSLEQTQQRLADAKQRNAEIEKDAARWNFFSSIANELQAFPHSWGKMTPEKMNHMCDEAMSKPTESGAGE